MALMARSKAKHRGPAKHKPKLRVKAAGASKRKALKRQQPPGGDAMDAEPTRPGQHLARDVESTTSVRSAIISVKSQHKYQRQGRASA